MCRHLLSFFFVTTALTAAACSATSGVAGGDDAGIDVSPSATEVDGGLDPNHEDGSAGVADARATKDAARKDVGSPSSITSCTLDAPCKSDDRCAENDGDTYRHCSCSADRLACGEVTASAPNTCAEGGACNAEGSACAADDGATVAQCRCKSGHWACSSLTQPTGGCSVASACVFGPQSGKEWLGCFERSYGLTRAVVCTFDSGGLGASGLAVPAVCPAKTPAVATTCLASASTTCRCEDPFTKEPCVCTCPGGIWMCLR